VLERDMEDLISEFPSEFFPRMQLTLKGRQGTLAGAGRYDLYFEDEHRTRILMELKARPAKYMDADQLAKYKAALDAAGERHVLMWLVATQIPGPVRDQLDRLGIEYTEIHEAELRTVAGRHGLTLTSDRPTAAAVPVSSAPPTRPIQQASFQSAERPRASEFRSSHISKKFRESREALRRFSPAFFEFLCYPEANRRSGLWLSTATNAHLYLRDGFLTYIRFEGASLTFSPRYNAQIDGGTEDRSHLLFPQPMMALIERHEGFKAGWAVLRSGGAVEFKSTAPVAFFRDLAKALEQL